MLCEEGNKNQAAVVVTTMVNGEITTRHLCRVCAKKYQIGDLQGVVAAVLASKAAKQTKPEITCQHCGMTFSAFQKSGRLGCLECDCAFKTQLQPILSGIHGRV